MHKLLIIVIVLFSVQNCYAQNHIEVYRYGILGAMYLEQDKPDSAEIYLRKALALMPDKTRFPHYFNLIKIANNNNDAVKLKEYFRELSCIHPKAITYSGLKEYAEITMDTITFNTLYDPKCILSKIKSQADPLSRTVDSIIAQLRNRDQKIRNKINKNKSSANEAELVALEREIKEVDSTNFLILMDCLRKYGFPDIELAYSRATLIMHIDNYRNFVKIDRILLKAIKAGNFDPGKYAYSYDRSRIASGLAPKYFWLMPGSPPYEKYKPAAHEITEINKVRYQLGLPPYPLYTGWGF